MIDLYGLKPIEPKLVKQKIWPVDIFYSAAGQEEETSARELAAVITENVQPRTAVTVVKEDPQHNLWHTDEGDPSSAE